MEEEHNTIRVTDSIEQMENNDYYDGLDMKLGQSDLLPKSGNVLPRYYRYYLGTLLYYLGTVLYNLGTVLYLIRNELYYLGTV